MGSTLTLMKLFQRKPTTTPELPIQILPCACGSQEKAQYHLNMSESCIEPGVTHIWLTLKCPKCNSGAAERITVQENVAASDSAKTLLRKTFKDWNRTMTLKGWEMENKVKGKEIIAQIVKELDALGLVPKGKKKKAKTETEKGN